MSSPTRLDDCVDLQNERENRREKTWQKYLLLTPLRHFGYDYDAFIHVSSDKLISAYKNSVRQWSTHAHSNIYNRAKIAVRIVKIKWIPFEQIIYTVFDSMKCSRTISTIAVLSLSISNARNRDDFEHFFYATSHWK